jgi:large subunit ribosomal protein L7Ae
MAKETGKKAPAPKSTAKVAKKDAVADDSLKLKNASAKRSFHVGGDILPKRDLGRFVRWPKYIRLQRQKKILQERLKVPPALNHFRNPVKASQSVELFKLLSKYRPETQAEKKKRLTALAAEKVAGKDVSEQKPPAVLKMGLKHVTGLVESKKAKLVVIASDVDPIELVVWLPALCRKMEVPYMIVNNKGRLGALVHKKTASCLALTRVNKEDEKTLKALHDSSLELFGNNQQLIRAWGGQKMGAKTELKVKAHEAAIAAERAKKAKLAA